MATPVTGLVMEKMRKMVSAVMGAAAGDILLAICSLLDHFAVARKKCHNSGKLFLIHLALHNCVKTIESLRRKAQRLRAIPRKTWGLFRLLRVGLVRACNAEQSGQARYRER